jgi:hypothetical protein
VGDVGAVEDRRDLVGDDALDVAGADAGLLHGGRVDVQLDGRVATGGEIALEAGGITAVNMNSPLSMVTSSWSGVITCSSYRRSF